LADRGEFVKPGVGEDDIEFTPLFSDCIDGAFSRFDIRYIGRQCEHMITELLGSRLQCLRITAGDCHPGQDDRAARSKAILAVAALLGAIELARAVSDDTLSHEILESTREVLKQLVRRK
jgi:hypothetical protein